MDLSLIIEAGEPGLWIGLGHEDGRGAFATADIGNPRPSLQFFIYIVERGKPGTDEIGEVAGTKEFFAAVEDTVDVFVPTHAGAGAERVGDARDGRERAECDFESAGEIRGAVLRGEGEGLLGVERELIGFFVVGDVAAGGLRGEPFADVALVGTGFVGEFFGSFSPMTTMPA